MVRYKKPQTTSAVATTIAANHIHNRRSLVIGGAELVLVPVVNIREMRVRMGDGQMHVRMRVRLVSRVSKVVFVLVMLIMAMRVGVLEQFMRVLMLVPFAYVQPDAHRH